ncbi:Lsr2 family DNA-binding protein [Quadrisphaera sp. KR29]|uniref:Lsr2 family DNA-binding protein n=1 Tax=Quadrisphaera sp. KR29 TaxID=3461391 RepID=UPI00404400B7
MGVLDRLMRRTDGARRFSLTAGAPGGRTPAGVPVMPLALRGSALRTELGALRASEAVGRAVTQPLSVVCEVAARAAARDEVVATDVVGSVPFAPSERAPHEQGYAVLDVVTSGPSPVRDRVLEVAVVQLDPDGAVVGEWTSLLRPSVRTPAAALEADAAGPAAVDLAVLAASAGASAEELASAPTLAEVAGELVAALAGRVLVAHGAAADLAHLRAELAAVDVVVPLVPVLCTLEASWRHLPGLHRRRLADCCRAAGVALDGVPTALTDARAAAGLLQRYLARAGERSEAQAAVVARAAGTAWPAVEVPPLSCAAPRTDAQPSLPSLASQPGRLAVVLESLALDGPDLPLPAVAAHVELLAEALAAGPLDDDAARTLALLADAANLTRAQVRAASRGVVLALAGAVGREPGAGEAEREELVTAARALAVDVDDVLAALAAAAVATGSLPRVGAASPQGAGPGPLTQALAAVRVPVPRAERAVRPEQPDLPASQAAGQAAGGPPAPVTLDLREPSARAAVRTWARERGLEVSPRGKLPRAVVEAYQAERAGVLTTA